MTNVFTPKQLARAIDVSESSVKRWCDNKVISTQYTAGGHRRIAMSAVVAFLRDTKRQLSSPEALGLPPTSGRTVRVVNRSREQFTEALVAGDQAMCWQIAFDLYLAEQRLSVICDEVFAEAFREIGERWSCGDAEVYQERRGCEIMLRVIHDLRSLLPAVEATAPLAAGAAPSGDQYSLGTSMAELVLRENGWNAVSLGDNLPFVTLAAAIRELRPKLFWISSSYIQNKEEFLSGYRDLHNEFSGKVPIVVGGYALTDEVRQEMQFSAYCDSMQHLEGFAQTLLQARQETTAPPEQGEADS